jgi:hypothetical protein
MPKVIKLSGKFITIKAAPADNEPSVKTAPKVRYGSVKWSAHALAAVKTAPKVRYASSLAAPTHDRPLGALNAGPGSSWGRDRYEVWTVVDGTSARSAPGSYSTFEAASKYVSESLAHRRLMNAFIEQGGCTYRIIRARGTCEVVG